MRFCPQCGKQIDDHAAFCTHCSSKTPEQSSTQGPNTSRMRLHCPRCKSTRLSAMSESVGSIGSATRVGKRSAVGGTTTLRQRFWTCHDCGNIFRNVDDLAAETKQKFTIVNTCIIIMSVFFVFLFIVVGSSSGGIGGIIGPIFGLAVFDVVNYFLIKKLKDIQNKKIEALRKACFD